MQRKWPSMRSALIVSRPRYARRSARNFGKDSQFCGTSSPRFSSEKRHNDDPSSSSYPAIRLATRPGRRSSWESLESSSEALIIGQESRSTTRHRSQIRPDENVLPPTNVLNSCRKKRRWQLRKSLSSVAEERLCFIPRGGHARANRAL